MRIQMIYLDVGLRQMCI